MTLTATLLRGISAPKPNLAEDASKVGDAYRKYFGKHLVAATAIQVTLAYPEMLLEVEAVAVVD